jgi:hypothetical protein
LSERFLLDRKGDYKHYGTTTQVRSFNGWRWHLASWESSSKSNKHNRLNITSALGGEEQLEQLSNRALRLNLSKDYKGIKGRVLGSLQWRGETLPGCWWAKSGQADHWEKESINTPFIPSSR